MGVSGGFSGGDFGGQSSFFFLKKAKKLTHGSDVDTLRELDS